MAPKYEKKEGNEGMAEEKFPWDYDIPDTLFWSDLEFTAGRNFLTNFTPSEIQDMPLDDSLQKTEKLHLLLKLLHEKLTSREAEVAPKPLRDIDYAEWQSLIVGIHTMERLLGLPEQEASLQLMLDNGKDGKRDMSAVNMMAGVKNDQGRYAEAEALAREVLPYLQELEILGRDSPQALGCTRTLIFSIWKQGREDEAQHLILETSDLIDKMGNGRFRKYQDEEHVLLKDLVSRLKT